MWSWTEMLAVSYRQRARTVRIPLRMNTELCRLGEGHSLCQWECRLSVGKPFPRTPRKCCQLETRASWWCLLQCTFYSNQSVPSENRAPRDLKRKICISDFIDMLNWLYWFDHDGKFCNVKYVIKQKYKHKIYDVAHSIGANSRILRSSLYFWWLYQALVVL